MTPYTAYVYYHGPRSEWSEKVDESEAIYMIASPWLWLTRVCARGNLGNTGRCGYIIMNGDQLIEHQPARSPAYGA